MDMEPNIVILGDALDVLKALRRESVDFIFTSPPYGDNRRGAYQGVPIDEYVKWFLPISKQLRRVLRPHGSLVLIIKERAYRGERATYVLELILKMKKQGWLWVEEYIWHKKNCYPGKWPNRFRDAWERCLHFAKQKNFNMYQEEVMEPIGDWAEKRLKKLSDADQARHESRVHSGFGRRVANWVGRERVYPDNVLVFATECANRGHPATFPSSLAAWFIRLFTQPNEIVLDPFLGSGSSALACTELDRQYIGIERVEDYYRTALDSIAAKAGRALGLRYASEQRDVVGVQTTFDA
jgi:DNA modification methylase